MSANILILLYSQPNTDHCLKLAIAASDGVRSAASTICSIQRAPELADRAAEGGAALSSEYEALPECRPEDLRLFDGVIIVTPSRMGLIAAPMKALLERTGSMWVKGELIGKVASAICSAPHQHDGHETCARSIHTVMLHHGMVIVGLPATFSGLAGVEEVKGGSPYGASTISGRDGSRLPSSVELDACHFQGKYVAEVASKLHRKL